MPCGCSIVVFNTQSIASEKICGNKISGDKIHPCLVSVFTVKVQINQCSGWLHSCYLPRSCEWYLQSSRKFHSALRLPKSLFSPLCENAIWSQQKWPTAETAILVTVQWWCRVPEPCLFLPQFFFILFFFITAQHTTLAVITILTISIYDWSLIYSFASFTSTGILRTHKAPRWLDSSVGRALHPYRRGHGFESRSGLNLFFRLWFHNCLSCVCNCGDESWIDIFLRSLNIWSFIYSFEY